jgi:hypothetical protein
MEKKDLGAIVAENERRTRLAMAAALTALAYSIPRRRKPLFDKFLDLDWLP